MLSNVIWFLFSRRTKIQKRNERSAIKIYKLLNSAKYDASYKFGILRNTDPFVFEELILTAFKKAGFKIKRNKRYTGDGGIDGRVKIYGWTYIQAKRYSSAINPKHVTEFAAICAQDKKNGLFIHTGRTGPKSNKAFLENPNVKLLSGFHLLDLCEGRISKKDPLFII